MRKFLTLVALVALTNCLYAQTQKVEKSEPFDEPVAGWNKVLLLKNGNTFFFHFTFKKGIYVTVFDKNRKAISNKTITSEVWETKKMAFSQVEGLYEINGEPVLFLVQMEKRVPTLYRIRFDPFTGDVVKEEEIGSLPKLKMFGTGTDNIYVEKDPASDCYAVIYFNGFASDKDERIKVAHYDGSHKMLNYAFYESPNESFKYLNFIGAVVDGNKRVFLSTYGASSWKGKDGHVFIARLNASDSIFLNKTLDFTEDFNDTKSVMYYNRTTNTIQQLALTYVNSRGSTGYFLSFMNYLDPETLTLKSVKPLEGQKMNDYMHTTLDIQKHDYHGMPQQFIINKDNSTTVLSEEMAQLTTVNQNGTVVSASTTLGAIGVSELNPDGTERNGQVMIKTQYAAGLYNALYMSNRRKGQWTMQSGYADYNSYLSYDFIGTENNRYIIYNDDPKNFDKDEDDRKRRASWNVNKLNTICYTLKGTEVTKSYLFGNPESKDQSNVCSIEASDYNQGANTYASLLIERDGHDKQWKIVWITFQ